MPQGEVKSCTFTRLFKLYNTNIKINIYVSENAKYASLIWPAYQSHYVKNIN